MSDIPCPREADTLGCEVSLFVIMYKERKGRGRRRKEKKKAKRSKPSFGLEKTTLWLRPSSPSLTCSTWLATFLLSLARQEPLLSPSKRPAGLQGSGPPPEALRKWSFQREQQVSRRSSHCGPGKVPARDAQAQRVGCASTESGMRWISALCRGSGT